MAGVEADRYSVALFALLRMTPQLVVRGRLERKTPVVPVAGLLGAGGGGVVELPPHPRYGGSLRLASDGRFKRRNARTGAWSVGWRAATWDDRIKRWRVRVGGRMRYVSRLMAECVMGRVLPRGVEVDHVNGRTGDNSSPRNFNLTSHHHNLLKRKAYLVSRVPPWRGAAGATVYGSVSLAAALNPQAHEQHISHRRRSGGYVWRPSGREQREAFWDRVRVLREDERKLWAAVRRLRRRVDARLHRELTAALDLSREYYDRLRRLGL